MRSFPLLILVMLGMTSCKERFTVCDKPLYFHIPEQLKISPPISLSAAPYGPIVPSGKLTYAVETVVLNDAQHVTAWFWSYDVSVGEEMIFSPSEEKAHFKDNPSKVYRMARFWDGNREKVRFVFRTAPCMDEDNAAFFYCSKFGEEVDLISEMICREESHWERPRWPRLRRP